MARIARNIGFEDILSWLLEEDPKKLEELWAEADRTRHECVGDDVHLRGLIEITNICSRECAYCGIRAPNSNVVRYKMSAFEIVECARMAKKFGYGTVVLQGGEDISISPDWIALVVREIKNETNLAVTLSLGERSENELKLWKEAGADRYLLRFETSNGELFRLIHPSLPWKISDRIEQLKTLARLGYEVGSGVMVGIPGQDYETLANDIMIFKELDLDMIGVGPYIPHPCTPLGNGSLKPVPKGAQVPSDELMTLKTVALTRLVCPYSNIPSTTALATIDKESGRELGLMRGANIVMPNLTPPKYRVLYEIYPDKACANETAEQCSLCLEQRIESIGRRIGSGPGGRRRN